MIESILYAIFAILGLGFLVFIHELGHYIVARRQGMRVEAFAIGFGKPIISWKFQGVKWQICILPFGGYVKIAGMQKESGIDPSDIPDGFFGKTPWQRIKVALAGPLVNIAFAFLVFTALWLSGGRTKNYSEFTNRLGFVDTKSIFYEKGIRPGDEITKVGEKEIQGFRDLLVSSLLLDKGASIEGNKVDYLNGATQRFSIQIPSSIDPNTVKNGTSALGQIAPAQFLLCNGVNSSTLAHNSGIEPGDRILWVDGDLVFSMAQLSTIVNESMALLTVERNQTTFLSKVPRVRLDDLNISAIEKAEISDWQYEAGIKTKFQDLYFIPYNLSPDGYVEGRSEFIDQMDQVRAFEHCERCSNFHPLIEGDRIVAVDGQAVKTSYDILSVLQTRRCLVIVERDPKNAQITPWLDHQESLSNFSGKDLQDITFNLGLPSAITHSGNLYLLRPMVPKALVDLPLSASQKAQIQKQYESSKQEILKVQDSEKRNEMLTALENSQKKLVLGLSIADKQVQYNPSPFALFETALQDTWRTLKGLFSGSLNPKFVSGPVGIIHVVHQSWMIGAKEALFWMAVISLNLGIMNLLPIPVLDGGHIMFSLYEMISRRKLSAKAMERVILPFVALLIGFFIFVTFQDVIRLLGRFF